MWIYGINTVKSVLEKRPRGVKELVVIKSRENIKNKLDPNPKLEEIILLAKKHLIKFKKISLDELSKINGVKEGANHQRVFAYIEPKPSFGLEENLKKDIENKTYLMLDGVTDPNNLGAIIRTAVAFGVKAIILAKDRCAQISDDVYKTSAGAIEDIDVCVEVNLVRALELLKKDGYWVYGFDEAAKDFVHNTKLEGKICCVMGGEDTGIRPLLAKSCDVLLRIPISSKVQSLNVAVATTVALYEVYKQNLSNLD